MVLPSFIYKPVPPSAGASAASIAAAPTPPASASNSSTTGKVGMAGMALAASAATPVARLDLTIVTRDRLILDYAKQGHIRALAC